MIEVFKTVHNYYDSRTVVKLNFHPFSITRGNKFKFKNVIVTTILENIHLVSELLISRIVYEITLWRLTLIMHSRIVLINTGLIKMLFMTTNQI